MFSEGLKGIKTRTFRHYSTTIQETVFSTVIQDQGILRQKQGFVLAQSLDRQLAGRMAGVYIPRTLPAAEAQSTTDLWGGAGNENICSTSRCAHSPFLSEETSRASTQTFGTQNKWHCDEGVRTVRYGKFNKLRANFHRGSSKLSESIVWCAIFGGEVAQWTCGRYHSLAWRECARSENCLRGRGERQKTAAKAKKGRQRYAPEGVKDEITFANLAHVEASEVFFLEKVTPKNL
ncbi:hypothetical protein DFH07DRAFT_763793 [Mycena maculata]|uniref:Uncharacterized protein n=1 Tax=Mycena maculata TaxID=230809 RepID=A0AAD7P224_9AGAR|nr:hypothetical protein DFH07DRAFT_763793 [Mycena maculata]